MLCPEPECGKRYKVSSGVRNLAFNRALRIICAHLYDAEAPLPHPDAHAAFLCIDCGLVLSQPVALPCSHSVICRSCSRDRPDKLRSCPCCSTPVGPSLNSLPENIALDRLLRSSFPDQYTSRPRCDFLAPSQRIQECIDKLMANARAVAPHLLIDGYITAALDIVQAHFTQPGPARTDLLKWCDCRLLAIPGRVGSKMALICPLKVMGSKYGCPPCRFCRFLSKAQRVALDALI